MIGNDVNSEWIVMSEKPSRATFRARLDYMVNTLRQEIISGQLKAGDYLPSELDLGEQFSLSKVSVRKGLDILVSEGLIEKQSRIGNMVKQVSEDERLTVRFGYYPSLIDEARIDELLEMFHARHPRIYVQTLPLPYDNYSEVVGGLLENDMLDVVTINYGDYDQVMEAYGSDCFALTESRQGVYTFLQQAFTDAKGKQRVIPFIFSPVILCYNLQHLAERGAETPDSSWTWRRLREEAAKLATETRQGFYFHFLSYNRWPIFLLQSGFAVTTDENGRRRIGRESIARLRAIRDTFSALDFPGILSESDYDIEALFAAEKVSLIMTTYFGLNQLTKNDVGFVYDISSLPYLTDPRTLLLVIGLAVNRRSRNQQAAKLLCDFLLSDEAQRYIRKHTLSLPAVKHVAEEVVAEDSEPHRFLMFRETIPSFKLHTDVQMTYRELGEIRDPFKLYWSGMEDEQTFCAKVEEILNRER
ncbi:extracellular solute-binding protein [Numidum massiliense]|uniref:extracellular solute-binding protein n=1 Tax=Numidum massiliense TaxID=1522315 RepID=UPI0009E9EDEF|nr:extracellular solute-binding protein [Numidum massiliense]